MNYKFLIEFYHRRLTMGLLPKEVKFFDMLDGISENVVKGGKTLFDLFADYSKIEEMAKQILELEHEGDILTHQIIDALNRTFLTPFDREDLYSIASKMDDIIDFIEGIVDRFLLYKIKEPTKNAERFAKIIYLSVEEVNKAVTGLRDTRNSRRILDHCIEINRLENEADKVYREAIADLLSTTTDAIEAIKWKEIYEQLEDTTDKCEDVANIIEGIIVKYT